MPESFHEGRRSVFVITVPRRFSKGHVLNRGLNRRAFTNMIVTLDLGAVGHRID